MSAIRDEIVEWAYHRDQRAKSSPGTHEKTYPLPCVRRTDRPTLNRTRVDHFLRRFRIRGAPGNALAEPDAKLEVERGGVSGHIKIPHTARSISMTRLTKSVLVYVELVPSKFAWDCPSHRLVTRF